MICRYTYIMFTILLIVTSMDSVFLIDSVFSEEVATKEKPKPPVVTPKTPTHKVTSTPFKIEISLKGIFESSEMTEISVMPETWTDWLVMKAVEHGKHVHAGETLVEVDTKKLKEAIIDKERDIRISELNLVHSEEDIRNLENSLPLNLEEAERTRKESQEDLLGFIEEELPFSQKSARFYVKNSQNYLEYEKEELRQLEKMYKEDDLTEETEEIILKRQRDTVERAKFSLERTERNSKKSLEVRLPRRESFLKSNARKQSLQWENSKTSLPRNVQIKKSGLDKLQVKFQKEGEKLAQMKKDLDSMNIQSPFDGIAYYGRCIRGNWSNISTVESKMRRGGRLMAHDVFMTIVNPRKIFVRTTIPENQLHFISSGLKGAVIPTGYPDMKLQVTVKEVNPTPVFPSSFYVKLDLDANADLEQLLPGMTCTTKFIPYFKENAITVPLKAVFTEVDDDEKHYVYLKDGEGKFQKQSVKLGKKNNTTQEILEGLKEDDEISLTKQEI